MAFAGSAGLCVGQDGESDAAEEDGAAAEEAEAEAEEETPERKALRARLVAAIAAVARAAADPTKVTLRTVSGRECLRGRLSVVIGANRGCSFFWRKSWLSFAALRDTCWCAACARLLILTCGCCLCWVGL